MSKKKLREFMNAVIKQRAEIALEKRGQALFKDEQPYYFVDYQNNLVDKMSPKVCDAFAKGSGNELHGKMAAVYSSSAMTFNIFGNGSVQVTKNTWGWSVGKYNLQYERQMPVLKRGGKANIDVQLTGDKEIIFFEMKMLEWLFYKPSKLARAYLHTEERYYNGEMFPVVKNLIKGIMTKSSSNVKNYSCKYSQFDAFQILKHIIGIYNSVVKNKDKFTKTKKITLVVGKWTVPVSVVGDMSDDLQDEYKKADDKMNREIADFQKRLGDIQAIFETKGADFSVKVMTVKEILFCLGKNKDKVGVRYL